MSLGLAQANNSSKWLKRAIDVVCSLAVLALLSPVLIAITLLVLAIDGLPVIYRRRVVGPRGAFDAFKFRTMRRDADTLLERDESLRATFSENFKLKGDPRVTRLGSFLRKSSLDELPQLFNVLLGDLSIVGPRPLVPFMLVPYPEFKEIRGLVRPGITGLWQIRDRVNNTSAEFMIEHDTEYIKNYSLLLDLKILAKTPVVVLTGEGAY